MDRSLMYTQEVLRSYDLCYDERRALKGLAYMAQDLLGTTSTMVAGLAGTPTSPHSLSINVAAGRIYMQAQTDGTAYGTIGTDTTVITQQGYYAGGQVTFSTSGLSSGQSQWALLQATFSQADAIPSDDPTSGVLNFYNAANPQVPLVGPGGDGQPLNTVRLGVCTLSIVYGTAATTGSEVPPNPSAGAVPLYLIDLAFGQTQISNAQILTAGPSVGTNVPNNYPSAPFIQGLSALANPRTRLTANTNFYVGPSGNDSNTGLGSGNNQAWQTLQHAWNYLISNYDLAGFTATINVVGNLTAGIVASNLPIGGGSIVIDGGGHTITTTLSDCFIAIDGAIFTVQNFSGTRATGTASGQGNIIGAGNQGVVNVGAGMTIGIGDLFDVNAQDGGQVFFQSNYTVGAGAHVIHLHVNGGEIYLNGITVTGTSAPTASAEWLNAENSGGRLMIFGCTFTGLSGASLTGLVEMNATLDTLSNLGSLPGNGTITLNSGGQKR